MFSNLTSVVASFASSAILTTPVWFVAVRVPFIITFGTFVEPSIDLPFEISTPLALSAPFASNAKSFISIVPALTKTPPYAQLFTVTPSKVTRPPSYT